MADDHPEDLTPAEQETLRREALIEKVGRLYAARHSAPKSWWSELFNSTLMTTLITVVIGGIIGQWILAGYQERKKRSDLAQEQYRLYIQRQQDVIQQALDLVGNADFDAEMLLQLAKPESDPSNFSDPFERKRISNQRAALLQSHTDNVKKWNTGRRQMLVLLTYYNYGRADIRDAWVATEASTTGLINCAENNFAQYLARKPLAQKPCSKGQSDIDASLSKLSDAFERSRQYSWQTPELPKSPK
jgi:hypothetical protein